MPSYSSFRGWSPPGKFCGIHQAFGMKDPPFLMDNHYFYGHVQQHNSYVSLPEGTQPKTQVSTIRKHGEKTTTCVDFRVCIQPFIPRCWQCRRPLQPQPPVLVAPSQGGRTTRSCRAVVFASFVPLRPWKTNHEVQSPMSPRRYGYGVSI